MLNLPRRLLKRAVLLLVLILVLSRWIREAHDAHVKESPVDFSNLRARADLTSWLPDVPLRHFNGSHIDDRYRRIRALTDGKEGHVQLYVDTLRGSNVSVVVKTISTPSRNELPSTLHSAFSSITHSWPSEIEATLALGARTIKGRSYVIPVYDYFILEDSTYSPSRWTWSLVTELVAGGTISDLAHQLHSDSMSVKEIDATYHGAFDMLLSGLHSLHEAGYCHDDVKPANIFVNNPQTWLLGDLGNVREAEHGYHRTGDWRRRDQLVDCRENDLRRAAKSYMCFLREASRDKAEFDSLFLSGQESWSKLYWCSKGDRRCDTRTGINPHQTIHTLLNEKTAPYAGSFLGDRVMRFRVHLELQWNIPWWRVLLKP